ncbi:MAG: aminotransferase class I/II-fold pyridoxal phosphate-dependent enzyme [Acholeplasmatales bacterium]|jgi:aspartate/tyrosine/aromatic aminotransferase|nr:aminotransferase class I/II-fold pyridoxal phosphate-dependent enzyme [Acholeplasmatales bacterium]
MNFDILEISKEARLEKEKNNKVIDATLGVLKDDNNKLLTSKIVRSIITNLDDASLFDYSNIDGGKTYKERVLSFIFKNNYSNFLENYNYSLCATPGAGAALYLLLQREELKNVILGTPYWSNYQSIITRADKNIISYPYFDDNSNLNLLSLETILKENPNSILLINDPCHNPTGYSLTEKDYTNLFNLINKYSKITLVLDLAYFSFGQEEKKFYDFLHLLNNRIYLCFSGSKIFSAYGLRIGALIYLEKKTLVPKVLPEIEPIARSIWGSSPIIGISLVNSFTGNNLLLFEKDLAERVEILKKRSNIFRNEAALNNLDIYPYKDGFFSSIKVDNPVLIYQKLIKKNIFVIPQESSLRISISNIETYNIYGLAKKIKDTIDE